MLNMYLQKNIFKYQVLKKLYLKNVWYCVYMFLYIHKYHI